MVTGLLLLSMSRNQPAAEPTTWLALRPCDRVTLSVSTRGSYMHQLSRPLARVATGLPTRRAAKQPVLASRKAGFVAAVSWQRQKGRNSRRHPAPRFVDRVCLVFGCGRRVA